MPATRQRKTILAEGTEVYRIHPIEGVYIPGRKHIEQDVTEAEWLVINEYQPPAFVCDPLDGIVETSTLKEGKD